MRVRMTRATCEVLRVLLHTEECYGLEVIQRTQLASGTVYPILARLERQGCVRSRWEGDETDARGPRRRFYRLTTTGLALARSMSLDQRLTAAPAGFTPGRAALGGAGG